ncbi:hypothetical protein LT493_15220 [Streptomyces tricolor]|nr:hypothetical protein [Streptomyces tricolor]
MAGQLRRRVEHRHHHVNAQPVHQLRQPVPGEPGQRDPAGAPAGPAAQERAVDTGVHPRQMPHRRLVAAAQPWPRPYGSSRSTSTTWTWWPGPGPAGQFRGHGVVTGSHARAHDQRSPPAARRVVVGGRHGVRFSADAGANGGRADRVAVRDGHRAQQRDRTGARPRCEPPAACQAGCTGTAERAGGERGRSIEAACGARPAQRAGLGCACGPCSTAAASWS